MKNKLLTLVLGLAVAFSTAGNAFAKNYPDVSNSHWAAKQIKVLTDEYVIVGYPDGTFKPDEPATRAEFANMVIKALRQENAPLKKTFDFKDVPYSYWAYNTIQRAIAFDLIKNSADGTFRPEDNISKAEAVDIIVSALTTANISETKARSILRSVYSDANQIPGDVLIPAAKSEILGMTAHAPESGTKFDANRKITRAEIAVNLYNMRKEARLNPNAKLAEAMRLKKGEGRVIDGVTIEDGIATIPVGAKIPVILTSSLSSQTNEEGEVFVAKADQNLVTKDKYLLVAQGGAVSGDVTAVKKGRLFIRNGKLYLATKNISTTRGQCASFLGTVDTSVTQTRFARIMRAIFKGQKINLPEGKMVIVTLKQCIRVDLSNGWILE